MPASPRFAAAWMRASVIAAASVVLGSGVVLAQGDSTLGKPAPEPFVKTAPPSHAASSGFRCDGTDPFFFEELEKAGTLGYGETWDETLCNEGVELYAEGVTGRWKAFRQPRRPPRPSDEDQMLALVMPMFAIGGLAAVFLAAAAVAAVSRLKKRVVLDVPCPACAAPLPIPVDDESAHRLFCPMCGVACAVDVEGRGSGATARARALA